MPWCPVCKSEYREGIEFCADCKVPLAESLEEEVQEPEETDILEEEVQELEEIDIDEDGRQENPRFYHYYQNSAVKAQDNRSSAYTLLLVGGIGFIAVLLIFFNVTPLYRDAGITKYLVCGIMGAMFILFIVFGILSMHSSRALFVKAKTEDSLLAEITRWCGANLSAADLDSELFGGEEMPEEQKYFIRADKMKALINDKFMNLDEAFVEHFVDEYYQRLFEDK